MIKKTILIFFYAISSFLFAKEEGRLFSGIPQKVSYFIAGEEVVLLKFDSDVLVSETCFQNGKSDCDASKATVGIYPQTVSSAERSGGRQASMIICADLNKGTPVIGRPVDSMAETSFCKLPDGTYLSGSAYSKAIYLNSEKMGVNVKDSSKEIFEILKK
jgi:hypothetical protein